MNRATAIYWLILAFAIGSIAVTVFRGFDKVMERGRESGREAAREEREQPTTPIEEAKKLGEIIPDEARRIVAHESGLFFNVRRFTYEDGVECVLFTAGEKGGITCNWPETAE